MTFRRAPLLVVGLIAFALGACSDTTPSTDDGTGGLAPVTGGAAGSGAIGGALGGGSAGAAGAGQAGTSSGAAGASGGVAGGAGQAGAGTSGASGAGGSAGAGGEAGSGAGGIGGAGGISGGGGIAGAGAGAGGRAGGGGQGGAGGGSGAAGGGMGGVAGRGGNGGAGGSAGASTYNPCPAAPAPCVILPYGDSITDGFGTPGGYRIDLFRRTLTANQRITFVGSAQNGPTQVDNVTFPRNHEGHSGWTIDSDATHSGISSLVQTAIGFNPNIVLLMIGTNDLNGNVMVSQAPTRLGNLVDAMFARRSDMLVVVAQIVPGRQDSLNARIMTYNAAIPGLVSTRAAAGRHIVAVDMYAAFTRDSNYKTALLADDLHPTPAGYARMSDTWYAAIGSLLR